MKRTRYTEEQFINILTELGGARSRHQFKGHAELNQIGVTGEIAVGHSAAIFGPVA
jgi:hypothetical protein